MKISGFGILPAGAVLGGAAALLWPAPFAAGRNLIVPLLAMIMFGMGLTLTFADLRRVAERWRLIVLGVGLQFLVMPAAAWLVGRGLKLSTDELAGLVLVGTSAGGTASNVVCYLAGGDVALSVAMTSTSTALAVGAMPALTWAYLGAVVPVPAGGMLLSLLEIVLAPVLGGILINAFWGARLAWLKRSCPAVSTLGIIVIIAIIMGLNRESLLTTGGRVGLAVVLHNLIGLMLGYLGAWACGCEPRICRTIAIEVGMQNSGLSVALAIKHFSPAAAVPGAIFSVWHNVSGSLAAGYWRSRDARASLEPKAVNPV